MIVLVTDPITNSLVTSPKDHPFVIEGEGRKSTKIYFETQENKEQYIRQQSLAIVDTSDTMPDMHSV